MDTDPDSQPAAFDDFRKLTFVDDATFRAAC
jgi:hypothetical protein